MSRYKPKGKELELTKAVKVVMEGFKGVDFDYEPVGAIISLDHAIQGVRCNGFQAAVTLIDVKKQLIEHRDESLKVDLEELNKSMALVDKTLTLLENVKACSSCKGKKCTNETLGQPDHRDNWEDCRVCCGRGFSL